MTDTIDHPAHYTNRNIGYECIDITQHQTFCVGNAIKYLWRYQAKGKPLEDLKKARWYTHRAMKKQETIDLEDHHCRIILRRLIETTTGYESAVWHGLLKNEWRIVLSSLDAMLKRTENDTQTL